MISQSSKVTSFFLGANSKHGFTSLYDGFVRPEAGDFLWVIKGGPGCGKSSFMRRLGAAGEAAGLRVEYILCSGDPDSLDGVYFPEKHVAYTDGTAPHVQEAVYPGASAMYLDLGQFLDTRALEPHLDEIAALCHRNSTHYTAAYAQLTAGAALLPHHLPELVGTEAVEKVRQKAVGFAARWLRKQEGPGAITRRFLSARSCQGHLRLDDTLAALTQRVWLLDNELGLGSVFLEQLANEALRRGYAVLLCPDPLEPERPEALVLPGTGMGFLAADRSLPYHGAAVRRLRLDALAGALSPSDRALLRQRRRESTLLLDAAHASMAKAKAVHDELEAVYHPHVDFAGSAALAQAHIQRLLEV